MMTTKMGLGLALSLVALASCSGGHSSPGSIPAMPGTSSSSASPILMTRAVLATLPHVQLANDRSAHFTAPAMPANLSALQSAGRHTLSSAGSSDLEVAGTFVQGSGPYTGLAVQNTAYDASSFPLSVPSGATGPEELLAPLTSPPGGSCVAATTGAVNTGSGPQTYFVVFNNCGSAPPNTIGGVVVAQPIDATFKSKYVVTNPTNNLPQYSLEIGTPDVHPTSASTWYVLLYNRVSSSWNIVYTQQGLSTTTYGYSVYYSVFQPGQCPTGLPTIASDSIQLYNPSGAILSAANTAGSGSTTVNFTPGYYGNANCFIADATGPATDAYTMVSPNTDWTVSKAIVPSGTITEYSVPNLYGGTPWGIVAGPDGNLWFTEENNIGKITPGGTITQYPLPNQSLVHGARDITVGPDGNLWFTEYSAQMIGKITTSGIITEYAIPIVTSYAYPWGIAVGRDGNLWFTESQSNKIGKITTAGSITEYLISTNGGTPIGIAAGPDGNLWFAENNPYSPGSIGQIATSGGTPAAYPLPAANAEPWEITAGPDGNLWFTEAVTDKVAKITTGGAISEYSVPTASAAPEGIAAGPDGNLWFTELQTSANKIGRITTSGAITEYVIPTANANPNGITAGPDGNLWFTENNGGKIGKITP